MITTLLDLLGALLVIMGLVVLIGAYVPTWATLVAAGLLVTLLSYIIGRKAGTR